MKCAYKPALLKDRVAIQAVSRIGDGQGGFTETWGEGATIWAQITPLKGYERMQAMQLAAPITHKLLIRFRAGLTTRQRLRHGDRTFDIREVIDVDNRHAWMQLICVEGGATEAPVRVGTWDQLTAGWEALLKPWAVAFPPFKTVPWLAQFTPWQDIATPWGVLDLAPWASLNVPWDQLGERWAEAPATSPDTPWPLQSPPWDEQDQPWGTSTAFEGTVAPWDHNTQHWETLG